MNVKHLLIIAILGLSSFGYSQNTIAINPNYSENEIIAATLILEMSSNPQQNIGIVFDIISNYAIKYGTSRGQACILSDRISCWNSRTIKQGIQLAKKHPKWKQAYLTADLNLFYNTK